MFAMEIPDHVPVTVGALQKVTGLPWKGPTAVEYHQASVVGDSAEILQVTMPQGGTSGGLDQAFKNMVNAELAVIDTRLDGLEDNPPQAIPSGPAGGVLGGTYPDPNFAQPMATQTALTTGLGAKADRYILRLVTSSTTANVGELIRVNATTGNVTLTPPSNASDGDVVTVIKIDSSANSVFWNGAVNSDANAELVGQWSGATFVKIGTIWLVLSVNISYSSAPASGTGGTGLTREQADARYEMLGAAQAAANAVTKSALGLGNVDNTSDANKPISISTAAALAQKADKSSAWTVSTGGTVQLSAANGNYQAINATGNIVLAAPTQPADQQGMRIEVYAPTTRTVSILSGITNASGQALPVTIQGGKFALFGLVYSARAGRWMMISYSVEP